VVVARGARAATIGAIAAASHAPTGSIYHRFRSVDELLAQLWIRAVRRSHDAMLDVDLEQDPIALAVSIALALYDFCIDNRGDALLLGTFRRADLQEGEISRELRGELASVNEPIERQLGELADRLGGPRSLDLALLALVDLPYGFARRYLDCHEDPPAGRRRRLCAAVQATLIEPPDEP
jgi:AcrR family transcriptional regulator